MAILYRPGDGDSTLPTSPAFTYGSPARVLQTAYSRPVENTHPYDVSPDGKRFLLIKEDAAATSARTGLIVVLNWFEELRAKAP
jgi:hypothetical protein